MEQAALGLLKRHEKLVSSRSNWDEHWQDVADYVIPNKDDVYRSNTKGEKKHARIFDCTPIHANELLGSALHGMLTNPAITWFDLSTGSKVLDEKRHIRLFLQNAVVRMHDVLNDISNFQTEIHETYIDLGSFGTAPLRMEESDKSDLIVFNARPIYELYIAENHNGYIDTAHRVVKYSGKQMLDAFPDAFDEMEKTLLQSKLFDDFDIIHVVEPRKQLAAGNVSFKTKKPYASIYIWKEKGRIIKEDGFDEFPYAIPRWTKTSYETYGRSPAMKALGDIKMINAMMQTTIRGAQKMVDPPLQVPDDGVSLPIRTIPGGTNYYRAGTKDRIEPMNLNARPDIGLQIMDDVRMRIRQAFFIDQLQLKEGPQMTATEVMQRTEEQLRMLGPILGRLHHELLKPIIDRTFAIMERRQEFGKIPGELSGMDLKITYSSMIARAQRTSEVENITRTVNVMAPFIQVMPTIMDNFNGDKLLKHVASSYRVPEDVFNDKNELDGIREQRAQQQQQMMEAQQKQMDAEAQAKQVQAGM
jgi:hypothetical protein